MNEISHKTALKKPIGVYILAVLFLLAPLGNILISFAGSGVKGWYEPSVFTSFLQTIPQLEWVWLGLLFVSGILLFRPHKLSWSLALFTLVLILCINIYRMYSVDQNSIDLRYLKVFSILALFCTLGVLVISFYFRFPYLDRRANWVKNIQRFNFKTNIVINNQFKGVTESVSSTGCRIKLDEALNQKVGSSVELLLKEIFDNNIKCEVVENSQSSLRLEFADADERFKSKLKSWIADQARLKPRH